MEGALENNNVVDFEAAKPNRAERLDTPEIAQLKAEVAGFTEFLADVKHNETLQGDRAQQVQAAAAALTLAEKRLELALLEAEMGLAA